MNPSPLRSKPVWKSTKPDDPAGAKSPSKRSPSGSKAQRTMHVRTGNETFIVHCLIIHVKELRKDTAKLKIAAFLGGDDEQRAVELCVLINDVESEAVTSLHAVAQAQMLLLPYRPVPVLFSDSIESVQSTLQRQVEALLAAKEMPRPLSALMRRATSAMPGKPLSAQQVDQLQTICPSIRDLEAATRSEEGRALINDFLDPVTARDIVDFWEDEWLASG